MTEESIMSTQIAPAGAQTQIAEIQSPRAVADAVKTAAIAKAAEPETSAAPKVDFKALQKIVQDAIDSLNEQMRQSNRSLNFSMDTQVNRVIITVRNTNSGEVIRQIPDEAILRVAHNLEKIRGLLLNEEA